MSGDPIAEAREALRKREFQKALDLSAAILSSEMTNEQAQQIAEQAREKLEASPFVEQFIRKTESHIANANFAGARMDLEKARSLDPDHPAIDGLSRSIENASQAASPPALDFGANSSSSFVVDLKPEPAAPTREFGFTFEEDKKTPDFSIGSPAAFSFDPAPGESAKPAPPPPPVESAPSEFNFDAPAPSGRISMGEGSTFDFATASIETTPEDQSKIDRYLQEGDVFFDQGDYQKAIDLWSRIFLIDVTNDQASDRIEKAKGKRLENDRRAEEIMVSATLAYEKKDYATAKNKFEEVLKLDPENSNAQEYLDRLNTREAGGPDPALPAPSTGKTDLFDDYSMEADSPARLTDAVAIPDPGPSRDRARSAPATITAKPSRSMKPLLLGVAVLIVAALGWVGYTMFFKPKGGEDLTSATATLSQAQTLARAGQYDQAITLLSAVQPDDPQHDRALQLIAEFKNKKAQSSAVVDGRPATEVWNDLTTKGRTAFAASDFLTAKQNLEKAHGMKPLPADLKAMLDSAALQVAKLDSALVLFKTGNYTDAITTLEALLLGDPQNTNIQQLLANAHFNSGVVALQEEKLTVAVAEFDRVLRSNPSDEIAKRSKEIATRYEGQQKDLLYKIYVKYLPMR